MAAGLQLGAGVISVIPLSSVEAAPFGVGTGLAVGGLNLYGLFVWLRRCCPEASRVRPATMRAAPPGSAGCTARREQLWQFQSNAAAGDINQITKQLRAAEIHKSWRSESKNRRARTRIRQAAEVERFLAGEQPDERGHDDVVLRGHATGGPRTLQPRLRAGG